MFLPEIPQMQTHFIEKCVFFLKTADEVNGVETNTEALEVSACLAAVFEKRGDAKSSIGSAILQVH